MRLLRKLVVLLGRIVEVLWMVGVSKRLMSHWGH
jgi:hypothetical protein